MMRRRTTSLFSSREADRQFVVVLRKTEIVTLNVEIDYDLSMGS